MHDIEYRRLRASSIGVRQRSRPHSRHFPAARGPRSSGRRSPSSPSLSASLARQRRSVLEGIAGADGLPEEVILRTSLINRASTGPGRWRAAVGRFAPDAQSMRQRPPLASRIPPHSARSQALHSSSTTTSPFRLVTDTRDGSIGRTTPQTATSAIAPAGPRRRRISSYG